MCSLLLCFIQLAQNFPELVAKYTVVYVIVIDQDLRPFLVSVELRTYPLKQSGDFSAGSIIRRGWFSRYSLHLRPEEGQYI